MELDNRFLFRAWDKIRKVMMLNVMLGDTFIWIYDAGQDEEFDKWAHWMPNEDSLSTNLKNVDLMQCLGRKDINKKLIFEGDIDRSGDELMYVAFQEGRFGMKYCEPITFDPDYLDDCISWSDIEIIGNIHENPNLLPTTSPLKESE